MSPAQFADAPFANGRAAIKFNSFWTIELEPGWSLFATHPVNRDDLPFRTDLGPGRRRSLPRRRHQFPGDLDRRDFSGVLPKGTPVAQCFAVPRARRELVFESFDAAHREAYAKTVAEVLATPDVYRKQLSRPTRPPNPIERAPQRHLVEPQPAVRRRGQRHRDGAEQSGRRR